MPQASHTFYIFVSPTFSYPKAELKALQETVSPHLRGLASCHGCRFRGMAPYGKVLGNLMSFL